MLNSCYFCTAPCEEGWCEGCSAYICDECLDISAEDLPFEHDPEEHQEFYE